MNSYELSISDVGLVKVSKKRGQSSLRIRLSPKGEVLVSAPWALPKIAIERYVFSKKDWIVENLPDYDITFKNDMKFGRNLKLTIHENSAKNRSKLVSNTLNIYCDSELDPSNKSQQNFIEKKVISAMKLEAEAVLLPKLFEIANNFGYEFNQAYVKNLKSRWGSCDRHKNIILNIYMLQLPDDLQEYVILHELTHTKHLNHSAAFWSHLESLQPDAKRLRKELKVHQPRIEPRI